MRAPALHLLLLAAVTLAAAGDRGSLRCAGGFLSPRPLTVSLGGQPFAAALALGEVGDYRDLPPGSHDAEAAWSDGGPPLWRGPITVAPGAHTFLLLGQERSGRVVVLDDDPTLPEAGRARLRLVGGSTAAGRLVARLATSRGVWTTAPFTAGTAAAYLTLPADDYRLTLHRPTPSGQPGPRLLTVPLLPLAERTVYTAFVFGCPGQVAAWKQMRVVLRRDASEA